MFIYAHRGASAHAPENTLAAIQLAIAQQADGIEFDVYQHNNEFVLIHDKWLQRTTNGEGQLHDLNFQQLRELDAGLGQQIPTLNEALQTIGVHCQINIEMKGINDPAQLLTYVKLACSNHQIPLGNILFSSFDHHLLLRLKQLEPHIRIGALTASKPIGYASFAESLGAEFINADVTFVTQDFVFDAKQRGLKFGVYTVDKRADLQKLMQWGVDAVFCNSPINAREILNSIE